MIVPSRNYITKLQFSDHLIAFWYHISCFLIYEVIVRSRVYITKLQFSDYLVAFWYHVSCSSRSVVLLLTYDVIVLLLREQNFV